MTARPAPWRVTHRAVIRRPPPPAPPPTDTRLLGFYRALDAIESGRRREPVVVLQIGDSHSANDAFSGRLRELFQQRFGAAGRGVLPAGVPYAYFNPAGVQVTASGWQRFGGKPVVPGRDSQAPAMIGLTAVRMHSAGAAEMTYRVDDPADLQRVAIEVLQQPGGGTLEVAYGNRPAWLLGTAAGAPRVVWVKLPPADGGAMMTLRARGDGPVDLLGIDFRHAAQGGPADGPGGAPGGRPMAGVIWANLGTVGAQVTQVHSWNAEVLAADLRYLRPDLILLAFGTNEGFSPSLDAAAYQAAYAEAARRLTATGATLAVIEPPDGNRRVPGPGVLPVAGRERATAIAAIVAAASAGVDTGAPAHPCGPATDETGQPAGTWQEPPALSLVRRAQATVAQRYGWFTWDWAAAMGGACSMAAWAAASPPLAYPDHVHLREAGARQTAEALFSALMSGYARFHAAHGP